MSRGAVDVLRYARAAELVDEDGDRIELEFAPGLSDDEIRELEREVGLPLPRELTAVLAETAAIDAVDDVDFTGRTMAVDVTELSPSGLPIAADGFGNFWLLDLRPEDRESAAVFFHCHDPPVFVYESPTLGDFLYELFRMHRPPLVDDVRDRHVFEIWRTNPGEIGHGAALAADEELAAFARTLDERFTFVDLRSPAVGEGFSWGRFGPRTELRRHGYQRLFAYAPPAKKPGLLRRLFGT